MTIENETQSFAIAIWNMVKYMNYSICIHMYIRIHTHTHTGIYICIPLPGLERCVLTMETMTGPH